MHKGTAICLTGAHTAETAKALVARLVELGRAAELIDAFVVERVGGTESAGFVCDLLSRNAVFAVTDCEGVQTNGERLDVAVNPNDTPDFAAEKVLDSLAEAGFISLESTEYTPEEEEQIRQRLADLGYIE